jgi:hypothetical protein
MYRERIAFVGVSGCQHALESRATVCIRSTWIQEPLSDRPLAGAPSAVGVRRTRAAGFSPNSAAISSVEWPWLRSSSIRFSVSSAGHQSPGGRQFGAASQICSACRHPPLVLRAPRRVASAQLLLAHAANAATFSDDRHRQGTNCPAWTDRGTTPESAGALMLIERHRQVK